MLTITGYVKGIKQVPNRDPNKPPAIYLGIAYEKKGGYPGEEVVTDLRFTKDQVNQGWPKALEGLKDKLITIPVFVTARAWKDRAFQDYYIQGKPLSQPLKAEAA